MDLHIPSDRHATRRMFLAWGLIGLVTLGILHEQNAWIRPLASLAGFLVLFAAVTVGGVTLLSGGVKAFRPLIRFVRTSGALLIFATVAHVSLMFLGLVSWPQMLLFERIFYVGFFALGAYGAFREVLFGVLPDAEQRLRDLRHHP